MQGKDDILTGSQNRSAGMMRTARRLWRHIFLLAILATASRSALSSVSSIPAENIIEVAVGTGIPGFSGDNLSLPPQPVSFPIGVAIDTTGDVLITDSGNHRIRRLVPGESMTTLAGTGAAGFGGDGGPGAGAALDSPQSTATDADGNMFVADTNNNRIRKLDTNGVITTVAGTGAFGFSGDGGLATAAELAAPFGVAVDNLGNLIIADTFNSAIRIVNTAGVISTLTGNGVPGFGGDGAQANTAQISFPVHVASDSGGNIFIADLGNDRVRKITPQGIISTIAGVGTAGFGGDGGPATSALLNAPAGVAVDPAGNLYIADFLNDRVRKVSSGTITTVAGNGITGFGGDSGPATAASLFSPLSVAVDAAGNLYIADTDNHRVRKVTAGSGVINTIAGTGTAGTGGDVGAAMFAQLQGPTDVAVDSQGNQFIADAGNYRIRKVSPSGKVTTIAGTGIAGDSGDGGPALGAQLDNIKRITVDATGNVYFIANRRVRRILPDGVLITVAGDPTAFPGGGDGASALLAYLDPEAIALDSAGNLFIGDRSRVRKVDTNGIINTIAQFQQTQQALGVALDTAGSVYIAGTGDVLKLDTSGNLTVFMSGFSIQTATGGGLSNPSDVEFDGEGNLYIKDGASVVKRTPAGVISRIAGLTPDDGLSSQLLGTGIGLTRNGDLLVAEPTKHRVRRVRRAVVSGPQITGISPAYGIQGASISAVVKGVNIGATAVTFSGTGVTGTVLPGSTSTRLLLTIDIAPGAALGTRTLTLSNGAFTFPVFSGFTVVGPVERPVISKITPSQGTAGTTFAATISGLNLTGATGVTFSGTGVTATVLSGGTATTLPISIAMTPAALGGVRTFTVTTPGGTSTPAVFTARRVLLTEILPSLGSTGTSMTATLTGSYLTGVNSVTFSGTGVTATVESGGTDTSVPITLTIASGASLGVHTVTALSSLEASPAFNGFTVIQAGSDGIITTIAGNGLTNFGGDGQLAIDAGLDYPTSIAVDLNGNLFIADQNHRRVRKVAPDGIITTVAGNGFIGSVGGVPATSTGLGSVEGIAVDSVGNLIIADGSSNRVLKVDAGGTLTLFAGTGQFGFDGDGGPATAARLNFPNAVQVDALGNVFIADRNNNRVRKVSPDGVIRTVAGGGFLVGSAGDGQAATLADLPNLADIAVDADGNLFLTLNHFVQKVTLDGKIKTISRVFSEFGGDGGPIAQASFNGPFGITIDPAGNLLIVDSSNKRVRRVNPAGMITSVAGNGLWGFTGDGGPATAATMKSPRDVATDKDGNLYIADTETGRIRKVTYSLPVITTVSPLSSSTGTSTTAAIRGLALHNATAATFAGTDVTAGILSGGTSTNVPVTITVGPAAALGPRPLSLTTTHGTSPLFNDFEVVLSVKRLRGQITSQ